MNKDTDIIEAEYTVQEVNPENLPSTVVLEDGKTSQVDAEFEYARANIVNILQKSNDVLKNTAEVAVESEHPRWVSEFSGLITAIAGINKSLLDLREQKMKIKGELQDTTTAVVQGKLSPSNVTNNTIFVGSTDDLIKAMKA